MLMLMLMLLLLLVVVEEGVDPPRKFIISDSCKLSPVLEPLFGNIIRGKRTIRLVLNLLYLIIAKESILDAFGMFPADTTIAISKSTINISG
jgi:hypothetical protein